MIKINTKELENIKGGFSAAVALTVVSAVIFISQIVQGFVYPRGCSNE